MCYRTMFCCCANCKFKPTRDATNRISNYRQSECSGFESTLSTFIRTPRFENVIIPLRKNTVSKPICMAVSRWPQSHLIWSTLLFSLKIKRGVAVKRIAGRSGEGGSGTYWPNDLVMRYGTMVFCNRYVCPKPYMLFTRLNEFHQCRIDSNETSILVAGDHLECRNFAHTSGCFLHKFGTIARTVCGG